MYQYVLVVRFQSASGQSSLLVRFPFRSYGNIWAPQSPINPPIAMLRAGPHACRRTFAAARNNGRKTHARLPAPLTFHQNKSTDFPRAPATPSAHRTSRSAGRRSTATGRREVGAKILRRTTGESTQNPGNRGEWRGSSHLLPAVAGKSGEVGNNRGRQIRWRGPVVGYSMSTAASSKQYPRPQRRS